MSLGSQIVMPAHIHLYTYVHKHILPHICKGFDSLQSTYICFI